MIILGLGTRQIVPRVPRSPEGNLRALLSHHPAGLVVPVVPAPSDGEEPLVPDDLTHDLEADPFEALSHLGGMHAGVPDVADGQRGDEGERLAPVHPGIARERGVAMAAGSPVGATGHPCGVFSDELAIGPHVRLLGWPEGFVHAVAPRAVEAHSVRGIGGQELRLGTIEETHHILGARRIAAQEPMLLERPQIAGLRAGCPARLFQCLVEVERLRPFALLAGLE
jgi:hypothetical protein